MESSSRAQKLEGEAEGAALAVRVLHLARRYAPLRGGTELYARNLAEAQARQGRRVSIVTLDRDVTGVDKGRLPAAEVREGVRIVRLPGFGDSRFAICARPDRIVGEIGKADVVHLHDIRFMVGLTCLVTRLRRRQLILHTHGLVFHTNRSRRLKRFLFRAYYGPLLRVSGAWIAASSDHDARTLLELVPYLGKRTAVIRNAIDLARLLGLPRRPVDGRVIVFGRLSRSKAIERLLEALATIDGSWELWIAGAEEPSERARLEAIAVRLRIEGRVLFRGAYDEAAFEELLSTADLAAFPSGGEGFGLALLEALAAALPVLVSDIPAHRDLLGPELVDSLVDFGSPVVAGAHIARLLGTSSDAKASLGLQGRVRATRYGLPGLVAGIDELYESLGLGSLPQRA
jgi:alpha-1,3-mannosyltransferase